MEELNKIFEIGLNHFNHFEYDKAKIYFKQVIESPKTNNIVKSDAFNLIGVIVRLFYVPNSNDLEYLEWYKKALKYNPNNLGALWNIFESYGKNNDTHNDYKIFIDACNTLLLNENKLKPSDVLKINNKITEYT